jgi:hypothetical protein
MLRVEDVRVDVGFVSAVAKIVGEQNGVLLGSKD